MSNAAYRLPVIALLLALALSFGAQRVARADDTEAIIGGIVAGAIVYELLDDDDDYYCRSGYYYNPPRYRGGYSFHYYNYPRSYSYRRYNYCPPTYGYYGWDDYYSAPRHSFKAQRAPSHARPSDPPPGWGGGGRKYSPPRRYK